MNVSAVRDLTESIAAIGRTKKAAVSPGIPETAGVHPDDPEIFSRFLYLMAVLDQGPDPDGVRRLLNRVIDRAYDRGLPFLHEPSVFFDELQTFADIVEEEHEHVKRERGPAWAANTNSSPEEYSLFFHQSRFGMRTTDYIGFYLMSRWGTPLFYIARLLEKGSSMRAFVEGFPSCELMTKGLKSHHEYGLGKAIGDKAAHLFGKWYVHTFDLRTEHAKSADGWSPYSYEVPFDSNAGRVLFRTGWLFTWASLDEYRDWNVVQADQGKGETDYIRVTNIRGKGATTHVDDPTFRSQYGEILTNHLQVKSARWRKVEIQQIPNALLLDSDYTLGEFDDGLMYLGTRQCFNHASPRCDECHVRTRCRGNREDQSLISGFTT